MTHITKGIETLKILDPKSNLTSTIQNNININTEQIKPNENIEQDNPYSTNNLMSENIKPPVYRRFLFVQKSPRSGRERGLIDSSVERLIRG